jgi:CubicO group peptidase (beta-lactamase class C family)
MSRTPDFAPVVTLLEGAVGRVFPAAQLIVVDGGTEVLAKAVGRATLDTIFDIASLTKALCTTTLAMRAVDEGKLVLDDEVGRGITPRLLLCHASGLPAWKLLAPAREARSPREGIVQAARTEPFASGPGALSRYSDLGFIWLGDLVEHALHTELDAAFQDRIAAPLGIATRFGPITNADCAPTEGELVGTVHDENARAMGGVAGHAGLFSTARDVSRIVAALVGVAGAPSLARRETIDLFWSPCAIPDSTWCLGWDRPSATASSAGDLWPKRGVGHLGFTGCSVWIDPPRQRWVVLLSNRVHPTRENDEIKRFRPLLHDAISRALNG